MTVKTNFHQNTAIKICGLTKSNQALQIASLGVNAIGVVGVKSSPRFLEEDQRRRLFNELANKNPEVERVWVIADMNDYDLAKGLEGNGAPTIVQLHGEETAEKCNELKKAYSTIKWWKAIRVRNQKDLMNASEFNESIDAVLIDTWNNKALGGTGERIPIEWLIEANFEIPWWLAGGVSPEWIEDALEKLNPFGIDASSKLEISPGIKDINKVRSLIRSIRDKRI